MVSFYVCLIAVLNLGLGFGVAVHIARRYEHLVALSGGSLAEPAMVSKRLAVEGSFVVGEEPETDESTDSDDLARESPDAAQSGEDQSKSRPEPKRETSSSETSLEGFKEEVHHYHEELTSVDGSLRSCEEDPDDESLKSCVDSLLEANQEYVESRRQAEDSLKKLASQEELKNYNEEIQAALDQQDAQIEDTNSVLADFECEDDLAEGCQRMVSETSKLLNANHELRDALDEASAELARNEDRLESVEEAKLKDELTELSSRTGLEASLAEWWEKDPQRLRQLNVGMIDVDQFTRLNERYGPEVCDRILRALAQIVKTEARSQSVVARFTGQQFMLLFPDVDVRFATKMMEQIRQTIEVARIEYREEKLQVTVSCAVVEVASDDESHTLYARAEATLREAKRYGRNRTFLHEGKYPTPVVPPSFTLDEKVILI